MRVAIGCIDIIGCVRVAIGYIRYYRAYMRVAIGYIRYYRVHESSVECMIVSIGCMRDFIG